MSLDVEDGTGRTTAESYVSVADADAYHTKFGNTDWTGTTAVKEVALRIATRYMDANYTFCGVKQYLAQALQWPRVGYANYEQFPEPMIVAACCELARRSLAGELLEDTTRELITRETVGPISTHYAFKDGETRYVLVDRMLRDLVENNGSSVRIGFTG